MVVISMKFSVVCLITSFVLLTVGQPIIQSQLDEIDWAVNEVQFYLTRADIWSLAGNYNTDIANWIAASLDSTNQQKSFLYRYHREKARTDMKFILCLLYTAFNNRMPDSSLTKPWNNMPLEDLQKQINTSYFLEYDYSKEARKQTRLWTLIKYLVYGIAVLLYTVGMIGIHTSPRRAKKPQGCEN